MSEVGDFLKMLPRISFTRAKIPPHHRRLPAGVEQIFAVQGLVVIRGHRDASFFQFEDLLDRDSLAHVGGGFAHLFQQGMIEWRPLDIQRRRAGNQSFVEPKRHVMPIPIGKFRAEFRRVRHVADGLFKSQFTNQREIARQQRFANMKPRERRLFQ